jgi:hypothetical protein
MNSIKLMHPPPHRELSKDTKNTRDETSWFGGSHNYKTKTKQTNLPSLVLGFVVSKEGRQPNPKKIEAIVECIIISTYKFSIGLHLIL